MEKGLPTVTSCCDSKTPGRGLPGIRERPCPRLPRLRVRFCGPLGACGRAGQHIPGRGGERGGRPCEQLAALARALGAGGGAWPGRRRTPSQIGLLCCNFSRALRGARARPASLPRESLCFLSTRVGTAPGSEDLACPGDSGGCVPGGRRLREGQP